MDQSPVKIIARYLGEWLDEKADVQYEAIGADALIRVGKTRFLVEYGAHSDASSVRRAVDTLKLANDDDYIPIVAVRYMGAVGERICTDENVSWIDLSGNADIHADRLRILIHGKPNRSKAKSGLSDVFAPKSSRVSRFLLQYPFLPIRQSEICERVDLSSSFVSRIIARMVTNGLVRKLSDGLIICDKPGLLVDTWDQAYDFERHRIRRGQITSESGIDLVGKVRTGLERAGSMHAFTGQPALRSLGQSETVELVTVFVSQFPEDKKLSSMGFTDNPSGNNVWFVEPDDEGVFHGSRIENGINYVHPIQLYLDLKSHPEPAPNARTEIRSQFFPHNEYGASI